MSKNLKDALFIYKRCRLNAQILEVMAMVPDKDFFYYFSTAAQTIGYTIYNKTNIKEIQLHFQYLSTIGFIDIGANNIVVLTEKGINALQSGILQNLSMDAYKNYVDIKIKYYTIAISLLSLMISTMSIMIACLK